MPPIHVLIKPASSACNLACSYCFYRSLSQSREQEMAGFMTLQTLETLVQAVLSQASGSCSFAFQGGEPTLAGLEFYQHLVALQARYNTKNLRIYNSIQTNGMVLNEAWAQFFAQNHFLVGLSLDGIAEVHNQHRVDHGNGTTFHQVMKKAELLQKYQVDFNILSVVTGLSARRVAKNYAFFKKQGFRHLQFIPCLEPLGSSRGSNAYYLSSEQYAQFLCALFDLWYGDFSRGDYVSIRYFDNLVHMAAGQPPESCNMRGACSAQFVIEGDGSVYPCDFYVLDEWKLGNIHQNTFQEMYEGPLCQQFLAQSLPVPEKCKTCQVYALCRNGCRRERAPQQGDAPLYYNCQANHTFLTHAADRIARCAESLRR